MIYAVQVILVLLACVLQLTLAEYVVVAGAKPNLLLVGIVAWSLFGGLRHGLLWAILGGLVLDVYSAGPFGVFTTGFVLIAMAVSAAATRLEVRSLLPPLTVGFVASLVFDTLTLIFFQSVGRTVDWGTFFVPIILPGAFYNGLLAGMVYWPSLLLHQRLEPPSRP